MAVPLTPQDIRATIERYYAGCNAADIGEMTACFTTDGVHYFPPGTKSAPWRGARTIAEKWVWCVENLGSRWTLDRVLCQPETDEAVVEWTHWRTRDGSYLRGDEWYVFDRDSGLIREIRAYFAAAWDPSVAKSEIPGFDYAGRGYPLTPP
ncbi:MAG: nuclear transport factor 2 family protein [Rhodospirillaceae bacterium]